MIHPGDMSDSNDYLADRIYLALELECEHCQRRFTYLEGQTEAELRTAADQTALAARHAGWGVVGDSILCHECLRKACAPSR